MVAAAGMSASLATLVSSGASWRPVKQVGSTRVHTLADIRYSCESPRHTLDVFFPDDLIAEDLLGNNECRPLSASHRPRPVYIHIHGGGWKRGSKDSPFYGAPAVSQNAAASGCIVVAPNYRLGRYPGFCHDVASAIRWVHDHIADLGGDLSSVFLSGHSAGGHIASLLVLRQAEFLPFLPRSFFRGLILLSGVYDLFRPLRKVPFDSSNRGFVAAYVLPTFGVNERLRTHASPLLLLDPTKDTLNERFEKKSPEGVEIDITTDDLPCTLILNASIDLGLQESGKRMAAAMQKYTSVRYKVVPGTYHASICWDYKAARLVGEFVNEMRRDSPILSSRSLCRGESKVSGCTLFVSQGE